MLQALPSDDLDSIAWVGFFCSSVQTGTHCFSWAGVHHTAKGFVAQHEARLARRRPAVFPLYDLDVGPADADGDGFYKYRALACVGLGDVLQPCCPRLLRLYGNRLHLVTSCCGRVPPPEPIP